VLVPFSPLADEPPPEDCDACWLPGGYPELHAGAIAGADRFLAGLRAFARPGRCMASAAATWCWGGR
jgi:cobyrinic acid a,c-diamide synthase